MIFSMLIGKALQRKEATRALSGLESPRVLPVTIV